jgi:hypothetical protein
LQAALLLCGSMTGALPVAAAAYMAVCFVWLNSTLSLARDMSGQAESEMVSHGGMVSEVSAVSVANWQLTAACLGVFVECASFFGLATT